MQIRKNLSKLKYQGNVLRDCIHSGKFLNLSLIKKYHSVLEHLQRVSKEFFFFQIFKKFRKLSAILLRVCPNIVINGPQRIQLTQSSEFKWIRTFIIPMRIYLINFQGIFQIFLQTFFNKIDQLLKTLLSN